MSKEVQTPPLLPIEAISQAYAQAKDRRGLYFALEARTAQNQLQLGMQWCCT